MGKKTSKIGGHVHWNDNLLCAIDTETTGLNTDIHEVIEVAFVPLDSEFEVHTHYPIFNMTMQPRKDLANVDKNAMEINKLDLAYIINNAVPSATAVDLFVHWFESLKLTPGKKLMPLAANYPFDEKFLIDWMGPEHYRTYFDRYYRDVQPVANFFNDRDAMNGHIVHYPKINLSFLANLCGIENPSPHRAIGDAVTAARIYKKMIHTL